MNSIAEIKRTVPKYMLQLIFENEGKRLNFPFTTKRLALEHRATFSGKYPCTVLTIDNKTGVTNMMKWKSFTDLDKQGIETHIKEMETVWKQEAQENKLTLQPKPSTSSLKGKLLRLRKSILS